MRYSLALAVLLLTPLSVGCSGEQGLPVEPEPQWTVTELGEISQADGEVRLGLRVFIVSDGTHESLSLEGTVEKVGSNAIRYDSGGCGCSNPGVWIEDGDGEVCRTVRVMCPCWTEIHEFRVGEELFGFQQYPLGACVSGPSIAAASFVYEAMEEGEWVSRSIRIHLGVTEQASP